MLKIVTLVGTRPELIKLSLVIAELDRRVNHILVHSGQNYDFELNEVFFQDLGIRKPDHFLEAAQDTSVSTIANVLTGFESVLNSESPDAVLVLGDTNSCLGVIAAKKLHIPIFHMEAGNRCFDERVPEEVNRRIIDHVSDINLVYTEHARRYLLAEGIAGDTIIKTGSPMREVLDEHEEKIGASKILSSLNLEKGGYFVVSAHREENVDDTDRLATLLGSLDALAQEYGRRIIFSAHPRTQKRCKDSNLSMPETVEIVKPLGFLDYNHLQRNAFCVVSDSGTITEEASILEFKAVMIRDAHERPEGMDEGVIVMTGLGRERIVDAVRVVTGQDGEDFIAPPDYGSSNVSKKVVRIILSYTDFVRRTVWQQA